MQSLQKPFAVIALAFLALGDCSHAEDQAAVEARLSSSLKYLAGDELGGRGVGSEGLELAAKYIRNEFSQAGLQTDVFGGSPFQEFEITLRSEVGSAEQNRLQLLGPQAEADGSTATFEFDLAETFNPLAVGGNSAIKAPLAFVGYGISAKDAEYDEYADIDVKGKVVVILRKEPRQGNKESPFGGKSPSQHAYFSTKITNAHKHGAAGVIFVNDLHGVKTTREQQSKNWNETLDEVVKQRAKFKAIEQPSKEQRDQHLGEIAALIKKIKELGDSLEPEYDEILQVQGAGTQISNPSTPAISFPVFFARRSLVDGVIKTATDKSLAEFEAAIDEELKPQSQLLGGWQADCEAKIVSVKTTVKNVAAVLEGAGPLADETIIVGAHYDHLGKGGVGSLAPWTSAIHNGADDNASGTSALLEVARRLAAREKPPARRIVFMAFSAEERGLLGSAHYIKNPAIPLEKTVAMVNMDMVGRLTDNKLTVHGTGTAESFDALIDELNKQYEFKIDKQPGGRGPSDHQSFYVAKVPVFHFYTGTHKDYHRPSDDFDKINLAGMARISGMVGDVVESIAAAEAAPKYVEVKRRRRPYLGTVPDMTRDVEGYALKSVVKDGPAAKAGVQDGDVMIKFADSPIAGLQDLDGLLRKHKAGDEVKVIVLRGEEQHELTITLGQPRG